VHYAGCSCFFVARAQVWFAVKLLTALGQHKTAKRLKYGKSCLPLNSTMVSNSLNSVMHCYATQSCPIREAGIGSADRLLAVVHNFVSCRSHVLGHPEQRQDRQEHLLWQQEPEGTG
jgi:hypothetical protein